MAGFKGAGRRRLVAEINVVPYIDVMLVLLVIFMVTAPLLMQGVEVDLPDAPAAPVEPREREPVIVAVKADGTYQIDLGQGGYHATTLEEIRERVAKVLAQVPDTQVLVWGDEGARYGVVVELMAALQAAGAPRVGLVTEPGDVGD
ncbi:MAG: protein TolR [Porticoccaceae bacterium]|nr:MAG: protein TolR [Porticoccaceae bacterium]